MIIWYYLALISAIFSAFAAILEKKILFKNEVVGFTALLGILNFLIAFPFLFFVDYSLLSYMSLIALFIKSIFGALAFLCIMYGIKNLELSSALPLLVLTPGLVAFFAFIFLGDALTLKEIFGMILLLSGTYVLQLKGNEGLLNPWKSFFKSKGYYFIISALILYTTSSILDKALLSNFKVPLNAFFGFQHLFIAIIFMVLLFSTNKTSELKFSLKNSFVLILVLSVFTLSYRYFQYSAVKLAPVALVLSLKRISVFIAVVLGGRLFKEKDLLRKSIATLIMLFGAWLVVA